ncbi:MAG: hypothetical protein H7062_01385 [Candidatus Saccharimonas sp.]|nr:hypothetical protein [Planctomycetaceae bacterium]
MRRVLPVALVLGGVLLFYRQPLFFAFETPEFEAGGTIAVIVDDEAGNRIEGVQLTQYGLRSVLDPGTGYGWGTKEHGAAVTVTTDELGRADIAYPKWVSRTMASLTSAVTVVAEHPDYCIQWNADCPVPQKGVVARLPHITLRRGGRLRIKAFREGETTPLADFQGLISGQWVPGRWQTAGDARRSHVIEPGPHVFRIIDRTDPKRLQFSKALEFTSTPGQTEDLDVPLHPGVTLRGSLSPNVLRPVKNGFVVVTIHDAPTTGTNLDGVKWQTWTKVSEDGDFEFSSLPPSNEVRLLAWCDGHVSQMPNVNTLPVSLRPNARSTISLPQFFPMQADAKYEIAMEPSARCEVSVTTTEGKPVEGVFVAFSPNVTYEGRANTLFGWSGRGEVPPKADHQSVGDFLRQPENQWIDAANDPDVLRGKFESVTDAEGKAVIGGLPGRGRSTIEAYHDQWIVKGSVTPPFRSNVSVDLQPGQTATAKIVVVPKPKVTDQLINAPPPPKQSVIGDVIQAIRSRLGL